MSHADYFSTFGLNARFDVSLSKLDAANRALSMQCPSRRGRATRVESLFALQWSAFVAKAYDTLRDPLERAAYLLVLRQTDSGAIRPSDDAIVALHAARQALQHARMTQDVDALMALAEFADAQQQVGLDALRGAFDEEYDDIRAASLLAELRGWKKLAADIDIARHLARSAA